MKPTKLDSQAVLPVEASQPDILCAGTFETEPGDIAREDVCLADGRMVRVFCFHSYTDENGRHFSVSVDTVVPPGQVFSGFLSHEGRWGFKVDYPANTSDQIVKQLCFDPLISYLRNWQPTDAIPSADALPRMLKVLPP